MRNTLLILLVTAYACTVKAYEVPEGWFMSGSNPEGYTFELDKDDGKPKPSGRLISNQESKVGEFGTLMQNFIPQDYWGQRVRLTAWVKSKDVAQWAGVWVRVDTTNRRSGAFDNMQDRPIVGTTDWTKYSIVVDVPDKATNFSYGILMSGSGELGFDEFTFDVVDEAVPVTGVMKTKPINNSF